MKLYALSFAATAHATQKRKYTGEPYITHPIEVAKIVASVEHTDAMVCAAYLHDVVEDCGVTLEEIKQEFGAEVEDLVFWLTDPPTVKGGPNRAERKRMTRERYAIAPAEAQTVKCADIISNTVSIVEHDPDFAVVYLSEVRALLDALDRADPTLLARAKAIVG
jgi:(p)ppGpp synthase/HD superfamily hydrolase